MLAGSSDSKSSGLAILSTPPFLSDGFTTAVEPASNLAPAPLPPPLSSALPPQAVKPRLRATAPTAAVDANFRLLIGSLSLLPACARVIGRVGPGRHADHRRTG